MTQANEMCAARVALLRGADLVASPWKNGGGVTREIAAAQAGAMVEGPACASGAGAGLDTFAWRVSIADVAQAGPFSRFEGVDRTLVLLEGAGMVLEEAGAGATTRTLTQPLEIASFAGETPIDARLVAGPTRDFNLMVRRTCAHGDLTVWRGGDFDAQKADTVLLYCVHGPLEVALSTGSRHALETRDTLRIDAPGTVSCTLQGEGGVVLAIRLRMRAGAQGATHS
ncbi:HutD family protein [Paraburkholderia sp. EG286B]|uniref:HutD family protein n=1 Tax=Paraburkholderia sp. EG286B TaxID=3237011 RepID=UPI0034D163C3